MLLLVIACATEPAPPPAAAPASPPVVAAPAPAAPAPAAPPADPARTAADEAFNTAMRAFEGKDPAAPEALRAALAAYQTLENVDSDGLFHVALLQLALDDPRAARESAERILVDFPTHCFALDIAARAAEQAGDLPAAKGYFQRIADNVGKPHEALAEYDHHARLVQKIEARATGWLLVNGG